MTKRETQKLRHMLGVTSRTPNGYRNYFVAGGDDVPLMAQMVESGLVEPGHASGRFQVFHATLAGAKAVGLQELPR